MAGRQPSRILMTADAGGGVFTWAVSLARAFTERGIEVHLAFLGGPLKEMQRKSVSDIPGLTYYEYEYKLEWMDDPWEDVRQSGLKLLELEKDLEPDIIHLGGYSHGSLPWNAPVIVTAHSCVYSWFRAVKGSEPPPEWERYREAVRAGIMAADCVVAPSRAMLENIFTHYGRPVRSAVIHNGADSLVFKPGMKDHVFFSAGRLWDEGKNIRLVGDIARDLPWPVYVAGQGDSPGLDIEFLGFLSQDEMVSWLSRISVFVHPALYEPFGLIVLEAAFSGAALVLGDIPSLHEIWDDAAIYVDPRDPDALRTVLTALASNDALRLTYAARARARAGLYKLKFTVDRYLELYGELLPEYDGIGDHAFPNHSSREDS